MIRSEDVVCITNVCILIILIYGCCNWCEALMHDVFSCWRKCVLWAVTVATCVRRRRGRWTSRTCLARRPTTTVRHPMTMMKMMTLLARTAELRWNSPRRVLLIHSTWTLMCHTLSLRAIHCYVGNVECFITDLILSYYNLYCRLFA